MKTEKQKRAEYTKLIHEGENIVIAPPGTINGEEDGITDVYTKAEIDTMFGGIDDQLDNVYTKEEVDEAIEEIDVSDKMDKVNPTGSGFFAMNIAENKNPGTYSHTEGSNSFATGSGSHAEGIACESSGAAAHAEGNATKSLASGTHAEGLSTTASNYGSHAEGNGTTANGPYSHAEGIGTQASGNASHAGGFGSQALGDSSFAHGSSAQAYGANSVAIGVNVTANKESQVVIGRYPIPDTTNVNGNFGTFIEIVGNGDAGAMSNARTLDWSGNEWLAGYILPVNGVILPSSTPNSTKYFKLSVDDTGTITATEVTI